MGMGWMGHRHQKFLNLLQVQTNSRIKGLDPATGASLVAQMVKNPPVNVEDPGSIPGSGRSSGEGNGNPHQYSCLQNFMDRGTWQAVVHGVAESGMTERPTLSLFTRTEEQVKLHHGRQPAEFRLWETLRDTTWFCCLKKCKGKMGVEGWDWKEDLKT